MYSTAKARSSKTSTLENPDSFYDFLCTKFFQRLSKVGQIGTIIIFINKCNSIKIQINDYGKLRFLLLNLRSFSTIKNTALNIALSRTYG